MSKNQSSKDLDAQFDMSKCSIGRSVEYLDDHCTDLLFPIPRRWSRSKVFADRSLPDFKGWDIWNDYEFYWFDTDTKSYQLVFLQIIFSCESRYLIESKSLKLYLFALNRYRASRSEIVALIEHDLSYLTQSTVRVRLYDLTDQKFSTIRSVPGQQLSGEGVTCSVYQVDADYLRVHPSNVLAKGIQQIYVVDLFRSNCIVSGHPDWATITIDLTESAASKIDHEDLLRYLVSYRDYQGIHEQCIERMVVDLNDYLQPSRLVVTGNFTRRGGLDINPIRAIGVEEEELDQMAHSWNRRFLQ